MKKILISTVLTSLLWIAYIQYTNQRIKQNLDYISKQYQITAFNTCLTGYFTGVKKFTSKATISSLNSEIIFNGNTFCNDLNKRIFK